MEHLDEGSVTNSDPPTGGRHRLCVVQGEPAGARFDVAEECIVGRADGAGLRLSDSRVSRVHARLLPSPGGLVVVDLGSANGTTVNGERVWAPVVLRPGDLLAVGGTILRLELLDRLEQT